MTYEFRCKRCDTRYFSQDRELISGLNWCTRCGYMPLVRVWGFSFPKVMHEHMNSSIGKVISDPQQFRRELARKSEEDSERRGFKVDYQPVDMDPVSLGVTDEGMSTTRDLEIKTGKRDVQRYWK